MTMLAVCIGFIFLLGLTNGEVHQPVDGGWSDWNDITRCTGKCLIGTKAQGRTCTNPIPQNGGKPCNGSSTRMTTCKLGKCTATTTATTTTTTTTTTKTPIPQRVPVPNVVYQPEEHQHAPSIHFPHIDPQVVAPAVATGVVAAGTVGILATLAEFAPLLALFGRSADVPQSAVNEPLPVFPRHARG